MQHTNRMCVYTRILYLKLAPADALTVIQKNWKNVCSDDKPNMETVRKPCTKNSLKRNKVLKGAVKRATWQFSKNFASTPPYTQLPVQALRCTKMVVH